jgi:hypothetical protein
MRRQGSYQNYKNGAVIDQLTTLEGGGGGDYGGECGWGGGGGRTVELQSACIFK